MTVRKKCKNEAISSELLSSKQYIWAVFFVMASCNSGANWTCSSFFKNLMRLSLNDEPPTTITGKLFSTDYIWLISNKLFLFTWIISCEHLSRSPITTVTILHFGALVLTVPSAICLATLNFISLSSFHLYSFPGPSPIIFTWD